jgi:hypothetical protein
VYNDSADASSLESSFCLALRYNVVPTDSDSDPLDSDSDPSEEETFLLQINFRESLLNATRGRLVAVAWQMVVALIYSKDNSNKRHVTVRSFSIFGFNQSTTCKTT